MKSVGSKYKMPRGEWLFLHFVILPAYLAVGAGMVAVILLLRELLLGVLA